MKDELALSPLEAAYIATNAYFTLSGWEQTYAFKMKYGSAAKGAPKPRAGVEEFDTVVKNAVGAGPISLAKTGIKSGKVVETFAGSSGSNLLGRVKSGFGYILQFERSQKKHLVIATRGTRPEMGYPDLLTDANISFVRNMPNVGPVHAGFYDVFKSIKPTLLAARELFNSVDVVHCVGHSLGGAVANLVALYLANTGVNVRLYTFGAPRVGLSVASYDKVFNDTIGNDKIYRVSHNFDPIPMIPVAPYIHAVPSIKDLNNLFIGSRVTSFSMDNHDTGNYIKSVKNKTWDVLRTDKLKEGYLDKQYFNSWRMSDGWLKQYLGYSANTIMSILQRILQGLIDLFGIGFTEIATILDLLALAIRKGIKFVQVTNSYIQKFIMDAARMFGMAAEITKSILVKLFEKLKAEIIIMAKLALATVTKGVQSIGFNFLLATAVAGSIGILPI